MKFIITLVLSILGFAAQAQTVVTMGPGTAPGGAISCSSFGCTNVPNSTGLPLSIGVDFAGYGQNIAVLFNGGVWTAVQAVPPVQSGNIAMRTYDVLLTSTNGTTARLQMVTYARSDRCNIRVAHGCGYYRIQPTPVPTITFN